MLTHMKKKKAFNTPCENVALSFVQNHTHSYTLERSTHIHMLIHTLHWLQLTLSLQKQNHTTACF